MGLADLQTVVGTYKMDGLMDARIVSILATFGCFTHFLSLIFILKTSRDSMNSPSGTLAGGISQTQNTSTEKLTYN